VNPDTITIILSMAIFFISFYNYIKSIDMPISSPKTMNEYFSGMFFLRECSIHLFFGRTAVLIGFPLSYFLKYIENGEGVVYFPLIITTWLIALYFYKYANRLNEVPGEQGGFFSILLKGKTYGPASFLLWLLRISYIASIIYIILVR